MKKILGLDIGTNSIGWALLNRDIKQNTVNIEQTGVRVIPMDHGELNKFNSGVVESKTAKRTESRSARKIYARTRLRRERMHRVLHVLGFLPQHYINAIDFEDRKGQFKNGIETKLNYHRPSNGEKYQFLFQDSFIEMLTEIQKKHPNLKVPYDWTLYYLRKKALSDKITKAELAWILLNFNQKRGYYQLRGEEQEEQGGKKKVFEQLEVATITPTDEHKKGKPLYAIQFANGWEYDKLTDKPKEWFVGQQCEFIVTTSIQKDGSEKRSFNKVKKDDWIAIKKKKEGEIEASGKTVGAYIFDSLCEAPTERVKGKLIKTIERKFYKQELLKILKKQAKFHEEFQDKNLLQQAIAELYPKNVAHRSVLQRKDLIHLLLNDILFYQRPLKSKKSTIGGCNYEFRTYIKTDKKGGKKVVKAPLQAIAKSHPLFEEFRLWQFLANLKIYDQEQADQEVTQDFLATDEAWEDLFQFLSTKKEVKQQLLIDHLLKSKYKKPTKEQKERYVWNYVADKTYPMMPTKAQIETRLSKIGKTKAIKSLLDFDNLVALWHIIYSVKDTEQFKTALGTFAKKHGIDKLLFVDTFKSFPPFTNDYAAYSEKAIKKLLPLMRRGASWNEEAISDEVKERISAITERLQSIAYDPKRIEEVADDDLPKGMLKSFIAFENRSPFKALSTYQACYAVYTRHSEAIDDKPWYKASNIDTFLENFKQHSLRNPIVEQVVGESLRVVRDIWKQYGNENERLFDEIHIELGREMKSDNATRERMSKKNAENEETNRRIRELLYEMKADSDYKNVIPHSPSQQQILKLYEEGVFNAPDPDDKKYQKLSSDEVKRIRKGEKTKVDVRKKDIQRYKLWLEQGYVSPYTGKVIPLSGLFTESYEIEHVIPRSRYFDDSMSNKVICETEVNRLKDAMTAYEFIEKHGGNEVKCDGKQVSILSVAKYEEQVNTYFKHNRVKLANLLSPDVPEGFITRQLNDTRYISKFIKGVLSNVVREQGEKEATSKNLIPINGAITSKLKQDWGLNDQWNALLVPRFERMNQITNSQDYGFFDPKINAFRIQVPDELRKNFNKKRIDHRHHALDAIVIACTTRKHVQYLNALNSKNEKMALQKGLLRKNDNGDYTKHFLAPSPNFAPVVKKALEGIVISFKQNLRVINKTNNKTWQWREKDGKYKKELVKQTKGTNWAIRKPLHKETYYGRIDYIPAPKGKVVSTEKLPLSGLTNKKKIESICDPHIRKLLERHLENYNQDGKLNFAEAFSELGVKTFNENITQYNQGKPHHPIYKVKTYEIGSNFAVSDNLQSAKSKKYVTTAEGTNLFFVVYWNEAKKKRVFETVPFREVVEHQKQEAHLPREQRTGVPIDPKKGKFLFSLSPNDMVYVPKEGEEVPKDFTRLDPNSMYIMKKATGVSCYFLKAQVAKLIKSHDTTSKIGEFGSQNRMEKALDGTIIKSVCWKLKVDRLGNITHVLR